jgi:3-deoxy-D-manno-octulosonic-acid transferase
MDLSMAWVWKIPWVRRQRVRLRRPVQVALTPAIVNYIKFVINSSTIVADPPDFIGRARELHPSIIALWHGQFFLLPGIYPRDIPGRAIVSRHEDSEALARVLRYFGLGLVRGAGAAGRSGGRDRGGAEAAHGLIASLREGFSIALTADVPPGPARKAGPGIIMISRLSGRPIVPFAVATSRYWSTNSWSRMTINLPFSKLGIVMGDPIYIPPEARAEEFKRYQKGVEVAINDVTTRAYALAGADITRATPLPCAPRADQSQSYYDRWK